MRPLLICLALAISPSLLGAPPVVSFQGARADITVDANHRVAWIRFSRPSTTQFGSGLATADGTGHVIIEASGTPSEVKLIVADVETGDWTAAAAYGASMVYREMDIGTILPSTDGQYSQLAVSNLNASENPLFFAALWVRPGVGAWVPPTTRVFPDLWGHFGFCLYRVTQMEALGSGPATPPGFEYGDRLLLLKHGLWSGGVVDSQLDAPRNPGAISMLEGSTGVWLEGQSPAPLWIIRTEGTEGTVSVRCCKLSGTAVVGVDYAPFAPRDVVFGPGEIAKRVDFELLQNSVPADAQLIATLENVSGGARFGPWDQSAFSIANDDPPGPPRPFFGDVPSSVIEADSTWPLNVQLILGGEFSTAVPVTFFDGRAERTITFQPGEWQKTIPVEIAANLTPEPDRTVTMWAAVGDFRDERRFVVVDDDTVPPIALSVTRFEEGDVQRNETARFVLASPVPYPLTYAVKVVGGSAQYGYDFSFGQTLLAFTAGQTQADQLFTIRGDADVEGDETINLEISAKGRVVGTLVLTLVNDDIAKVLPRVSIDDVFVTETDTWSEARFTLRLSEPSGEPVTVDWRTFDGTALAHADYEFKSGRVSFAPGQTTASIPLGINGDKTVEPAEWFAVELSGPQGATIEDGRAICTIENDDMPARRRSARH